MAAPTINTTIQTGEEPKIGGLPASMFIKRRVKVQRDDRGHAVPITCVGYRNGKVALKRDKGGTLEYVDPRDIKVWWSQNPDLYEIAKSRGLIPYEGGSPMSKAFEVAIPAKPPEPEPPAPDPEPEPEPEVEPAPEPEPTIEEEKASIVPNQEMTPEPKKESPSEVSVKGRKISGFQLGIDADMSWMEDFKSLQEMVKENTAFSLQLAEIRAKIDENESMIEMAVESLEDKGVKILWEKEDIVPAAAIAGKLIVTNRLFIAHNGDRPDVPTVCVRNEFGRYCYIDPKDEYFKLRLFDNIPGEETPIGEFGVKVELLGERTEKGEGVLVGTKIGVSKAKYADGGARRWQGGDRFMIYVPEKLMEFIEKK